jgi:hypothetical protein
LAQRLVVFLMVGGVAGFGAVFLELPGLVLGLVILAVVAGRYRTADLLPAGAYLLGFGLVGWSLIGPAVKGGGGFLFLGGWQLVALYAAIAITGAAMIAYLALRALTRHSPSEAERTPHPPKGAGRAR